MPTRWTVSHVARMTWRRAPAVGSGATGTGPGLQDVAARRRGCGVVVVSSDWIDAVQQVIDGLSHFKHQRNDVIVFQLIDPAELAFPYDRLTRFKDMEGAGTVLTHPRSVRKEYLKRLEAFLARCRTDCLERGMSYELLPTQTPYEKALSAYLEKRKKMK